MATWHNPRVWVAQETVTAAIFTNMFRDNLLFLKEMERVHCWHSEDKEIKADEWEVLRWDQDKIDNNNMHNHKRRNARIKIHHDGIYKIYLKVNFEADVNGARKVQLRKNSDESETGGQALGITTKEATTNGQTVISVTRIERFSQGDHINAFAWQNSGDKRDIIAGGSTSFLQAIQLSG